MEDKKAIRPFVDAYHKAKAEAERHEAALKQIEAMRRFQEEFAKSAALAGPATIQ